jgi:predicted nucleic acid-binding protein
MRYVLDASIALKWVLAEPDSSKADRLRQDLRNQIHEFIAPDSFLLEVAHGLAKAERRGVIQRPQGTAHLINILATCPVLHPSAPLLMRAFALASASRIGVYDCLFVVLSDQEGCDLLTADDRLARSLPTHRLVTLSSLP